MPKPDDIRAYIGAVQVEEPGVWLLGDRNPAVFLNCRIIYVIHEQPVSVLRPDDGLALRENCGAEEGEFVAGFASW
jgi:hypothetical protein